MMATVTTTLVVYRIAAVFRTPGMFTPPVLSTAESQSNRVILQPLRNCPGKRQKEARHAKAAV